MNDAWNCCLTCNPVMTSPMNTTPIQTTIAFFTVPSTLRVRLLAVWMTTYARELTRNPMAAAEKYSKGFWRIKSSAPSFAMAGHSMITTPSRSHIAHAGAKCMSPSTTQA